MNTICQDRDITASALEAARICAQEHASAIMCYALETDSVGPHLSDRPPNATREQVGKKGLGSWQTFANWIQLADRCQLDFVVNQQVTSKLARWQEGKSANLPTELTRCFCSLSIPGPVVGDSPSYYVGEGANALSPLRREVPCPVSPGSMARTVVLAIDLGTATGWAMRTLEGQITHGVAGFRPGRYEGGGMRYLRFKRWLSELRTLATEIHSVYFEEVRRHVGVDAAHVYGGLLATLTTWCEHHNIPYQGVPVGTIKRHATGKGNASKTAVSDAMRALGHAVNDDNDADALALLHWALDTQEG